MVINITRLIAAGAAVLAAAGIAAGAVAVTNADWIGSFPPDRSDHIELAQAAPATPSPPSAPAQPAPAQPAAPAQTAPPAAPLQQTATPTTAQQSDADVVFTLVRTTIIALHQADITGNYTVLRDLAAPGFREKNSAADLGRIFTPVRDARIDLGAVVLLDPHITRAALNDQKMLDVVGSLDTKPLPVSFELLFQPVDGIWRVFGISVTPVQRVGDANTPAPLAASSPAPRQRAKKPAAKPKPAE